MLQVFFGELYGIPERNCSGHEFFLPKNWMAKLVSNRGSFFMAHVPNSSTHGLGVELRIAYPKVVGRRQRKISQIVMNHGDVFFMGSNP